MGPKAAARQVSGAQVRAYANKADEYAEAAEAELQEGRTVAATSLAIHAGINAADAVCGARLGQRSAGDHSMVLALLKQAGKDGAEIETQLRRLLPLKTKAEYDPDTIAKAVAEKAVERAQRCRAIAHRVAAGVR